jgi:hypothetical protein
MESLTDAEIAELNRFAVGLSKPDMPVRIEYAPPHVTVHFKKPGQRGLTDAQHSFPLSRYTTLEKLKTDIKSHAGL